MTMATFQKVKLGDIAEIIMGQSPESKYYNETGNGLPFFQGVKDFGEKYPIETKWTTYANKVANTKDILFSVRAPVGEMNVANKKSALGRGVCAIRSKINQGDFLYFLLRANIKKIINLGNGSVYDAINRPILEKIEFFVPDIPIQARIASILSAYDDLIENNEKRIKALEEMAQLLYTEWFVKFEFPVSLCHPEVAPATEGSRLLGYKSNGGKMVDSGTEYGMVPVGWVVKKLKEIANLIMGQSPTSDNYNFENQGFPFHQGVTDFGYKYPINRVYSIAGNKFAENGDLLFSVRAPVGYMNIANKKIILGRGLSAIRHKKGWQSLLYLMFDKKFTEKDMIGNGAIYKSVTKAELENLSFVVPTEYVAEYFEDIISAYFQEMEKITVSNIILSKTRDLLIPQLVTGKRELKKLT